MTDWTLCQLRIHAMEISFFVPLVKVKIQCINNVESRMFLSATEKALKVPDSFHFIPNNLCGSVSSSEVSISASTATA